MPGSGRETVADLAAFLDLDVTDFSTKLAQARLGMITAAEDMALPLGKIKQLLAELNSELGPTATKSFMGQLDPTGGNQLNAARELIGAVANLKDENKQLDAIKAQGLAADQAASDVRRRIFAQDTAAMVGESQRRQIIEEAARQRNIKWEEHFAGLSAKQEHDRSVADQSADALRARYQANQLQRLEEIRVKEQQADNDRKQSLDNTIQRNNQLLAAAAVLAQQEIDAQKQISSEISRQAAIRRAAAEEADRATRTQIAGIRSIGSDLKGIGSLLTATVTAPLIGVAAFALKAQSDVQQATIAFKQLTGSENEALAVVQRLRDISTSTPLEFGAIVTATKRMVALGLSTQEAVDNLKGIGGAATIMGTGAAGIERVSKAVADMKAKGTVQAEEMRQLANAGIPGWELLAKVLNVTVADAMDRVKKRAVDSATFVPAILAELNSRYGKVLEEMAQTTGGQFEIMKNRMTFAMQDLGVVLAPIATSIMRDFGMPLINGITDVAANFKQLPEPIKNTTVALFGLAALSGPVLYFTGSLVGSLANVLDLMVKLGSVNMARGALAFIAGAGAAGAVGLGSALVGAGIGYSELQKNLEGLHSLDKAYAEHINKQIIGSKDLADATFKLKQSRDIGAISAIQYEELSGLLVKREKELADVERNELTAGWRDQTAQLGLNLGSRVELRKQMGLDATQVKALTAEQALATLGIKHDTEERKAAYKQAVEAFNTLKAAGEGPAVLEQAAKAVKKAFEELNGEAEKINKTFKAIPFAEKSEAGAILAAKLDLDIAAMKKLDKELAATGETTAFAQAAVRMFKKELEWREDTEKAAANLDNLKGSMKDLQELFGPSKEATKLVGTLDGTVEAISRQDKAVKLLGITAKQSLPDLNDALQTASEMAESGAINQDQLLVGTRNYLKAKADIGRANEAELEQLKRLDVQLKGAYREATAQVRTFGDEVAAVASRGIDRVESSLARNIVHWKGWKDTLIDLGQDTAESFLKVMFKGLFGPLEKELEKQAKKLGDWLGKVLGIGKSPASQIPGVSIPGIGGLGGGGGAGGPIGPDGLPLGLGGGGAGGAGAAQGAVSGLSGWIGAIGSVGTMVSSIIGNFQQAKMETTMNAVEHNTRYTAIDLANLKSDQWSRHGNLLMKLDDIWNEIRNVVKSYSGSGGTVINIQGVQDLDQLVRELKARGVKVAFA